MLPPFPVLFSKAPPTLVQLLFGNGENGFLFQDFTELNELYTTSQGPTQVSADSDPVGLALDDHSWADRTLAQQLAISPELSSNPGGPFTVTTGYTPNGATLSIVGGNLRVTSTGAGFIGQTSIPFTTVVGKTYAALFTSVGGTGGIGTLRVGTAAGGTQNGAFSPGVGTWTYYFVATATTTYYTLTCSTVAGEYVDYTIASGKLLDGNHGVQATAVSRPLWRSNSGNPYLQYDGVNDYLQSTFAPSPVCTLMAKIGQAAAPGATKVIMGATDGANPVQLRMNANGQFAGLVGTTSIITGGPIIAGTRGIAAFVYNGANAVLYVNGVTVATAVQAGTNNAQPLAIGGQNSNGTVGTFFPGDFYGGFAVNKALTPAQVSYITNLWGLA